MNDSFNDAQQAANVAYQMTQNETGDPAQASAAYKSVMAAYYSAQQPVYDAASHAATIAARHEQTAPDVDLFEMRDLTGKHVMPMTVETRCLLHLINDDNGMWGDRG